MVAIFLDHPGNGIGNIDAFLGEVCLKQVEGILAAVEGIDENLVGLVGLHAVVGDQQAVDVLISRHDEIHLFIERVVEVEDENLKSGW